MLKVLSSVAEIFVPLAGDVVENIKSKDGGVGRFLTPKFIKQVIRLLVTIGATYMFVKGDLSAEDLLNITE